jgi:predicted nucleotidyltransferase
METLIKQTREVGTSAGVLLPRKWLNKQVVVTLHIPSGQDIALDIIKILFERKLNDEVRGIYLFGSYARGDYDFESDIDVLVLTQNVNKLIKQENYELLLVSEQSFLKNLPRSLNYLSILKEAKVIFEKYRAEDIELDLKDILKEIGGVIKINEDSLITCKESKQNIPDGIVYSIVLRLRELYLIRCLRSNKMYRKSDFLKIVGETVYSAYTRVKNNEKEYDNISYEEIKNLSDLSSKWLEELKE